MKKKKNQMEMMDFLEEQEQKNLPQHIEDQKRKEDQNKEGEDYPEIQGGHHIWTLVQDKISKHKKNEKDYCCEDVRIQLKEALLEIYNFGEDEQKSKKTPVYFPLMAQAISKDKEKDQILVRFVGCQRFQITKKFASFFNLDSIQPRVYMDFTSFSSIKAYLQTLQEKKEMEILYFLTEIIPSNQKGKHEKNENIEMSPLKKGSKNLVRFNLLEEYTYILNQIQRKESLGKQSPIKSKKIDIVNGDSKINQTTPVYFPLMTFDFEKEQLKKSKGSEIVIDYDYKLKIKVQSGLKREKETKFFNEKIQWKEKSLVKNLGTFFESIKAQGKKKEKKLQEIRKASNLLYYFPHLQKNKQFLMVLVHLPDYVGMESLNFISRYLLKANLLSIQGKVHIRFQSTLKE